MASRGDHFPNLSQAKEFLADRSAQSLEKKALTFGWPQVPANGTEISLVLWGKGRSFRLSFIFEGSQASKKRASPDWPIATPFRDLRAFAGRVGRWHTLANQSRPGLAVGGRRPIDEAGQSALP